MVGRLDVCFRWVLVGSCIWLLYGYQGADADLEQLALTLLVSCVVARLYAGW